MDVIPAKAGISPLLKRPVTMSGGVFCFNNRLCYSAISLVVIDNESDTPNWSV